LKTIIEYIWLFLHDNFAVGFSLYDLLLAIIQISVILLLLYTFYKRVKGTAAERILKGFLVIISIVALFYVFHLTILTKIFELLIPSILIGLIVLLAPEFRGYLQTLGKEGFSWLNLLNRIKDFNINNPSEEKEQNSHETVEKLFKGIEILSRNKTGALIVLDNTWSDKLYISSGVKLDAFISTELLLNIFYPKSPLHDGAVVIRDKRVVAASVILPITDNPKLNPWQYGTRHRAALGISELNNAILCIVISEETGSVSISEKGQISKISILEELKPILEKRFNK